MAKKPPYDGADSDFFERMPPGKKKPDAKGKPADKKDDKKDVMPFAKKKPAKKKKDDKGK